MLTIRLLTVALLGLLATASVQAKQGESLYHRTETNLDQSQQAMGNQAEKAKPRYGIKGDLIGKEERRLPYRRAESDRRTDK